MAAPRVRITSQLEAQIRAAGLNPQTLITNFGDWKSGHPDDHYVFGHDVLGIGSSFLFHAHMVPLAVTADKANWDIAWRSRRRRTSDRYVFYADGGAREGFLLIAVIDDPGGHAVWNSQAAVNRLEKVAEDFCVFGTVP